MTASPVRSFGKYLLDEEIARGGMSRVFLARLRGLGGFEKRLVVKQVLPELASDPRFVEMFVQEAKTLVQMSHPHIAPVFELGVVDGVYFLAMEHVAGATLSEILASGPLPPELVAHVGAQIGDALHYAHERFGIVHRDVTPRNVMVDEEGHARLLDFGIAAPVTGEEGGALFGTPGYLSPEQARGEPIGPASDVFALGAVLFEALTARRAFFARTVEEARGVLELDGPDFYPGDGVPPELAAIVDRALSRDRAGRYASARALGRALRSWVAAHAPEGVGPELGARARAASAPVPQARGEEPADEPRSGEVEVRTLATSRVLDALLDAPDEPEAGTSELDRSSEPTTDGESGTVRLSRVSAPPADDEVSPGTAKLDRPRAAITPPSELAEAREPEGAAATEATRATEAEAEAPEAPEEASRERASSVPAAPVAPRVAFWRRPELVALAALAAGALAWWAWPAASPPPPRPAAVLDAPPPEPVDEPVGQLDEPAEPPDAVGVPADAVDEPPPEGEVAPSVVETSPSPRPAARGTLEVNSVQPAQVFVDGRLVGWTPLRGHALRAGRHRVALRSPHLAGEAAGAFDLEAGETLRLVGDLERGQLSRPR
ncbi:MAG: protein kinase [Sandaracinaceae bacterium]|nr:protein kinase [Sandaracinaceae bacterium]